MDITVWRPRRDGVAAGLASTGHLASVAQIKMLTARVTDWYHDSKGQNEEGVFTTAVGGGQGGFWRGGDVLQPL